MACRDLYLDRLEKYIETLAITSPDQFFAYWWNRVIRPSSEAGKQVFKWVIGLFSVGVLWAWSHFTKTGPTVPKITEVQPPRGRPIVPQPGPLNTFRYDAEGVTTVKLEKPWNGSQVEVFDTGGLLASGVADEQGNTDIDLTALPPGTYPTTVTPPWGKARGIELSIEKRAPLSGSDPIVDFTSSPAPAHPSTNLRLDPSTLGSFKLAIQSGRGYLFAFDGKSLREQSSQARVQLSEGDVLCLFQEEDSLAWGLLDRNGRVHSVSRPLESAVILSKHAFYRMKGDVQPQALSFSSTPSSAYPRVSPQL